MFNIGTPELLVVLVIAMVVVGPERLPELARWIARGVRELRKVQDDVRDMVQTGMGDEFRDAANEMKGAVTELRKTASEVKSDVKRAASITPASPAQPPQAEPTPVAGDGGPDADEGDRPRRQATPIRDAGTAAPVTEAPAEHGPAADPDPGATAAE
jgi:sec-independent protein translocase protein TatB